MNIFWQIRRLDWLELRRLKVLILTIHSEKWSDAVEKNYVYNTGDLSSTPSAFGVVLYVSYIEFSESEKNIDRTSGENTFSLGTSANKVSSWLFSIADHLFENGFLIWDRG